MDEQHAIACLKRGDLTGLEWLVQRYQIQALHAAYLIVGDRALAEDVTQSAFLRAAEKINQFDESRPFGSWFLRSVANAAIKVSRRRQRQIPLDAGADEDERVLAAYLKDGNPGPEALLENEETRQAVWAALSRLKPEHRAAIILKYFLGLSDAESAAQLGRPLTTVKWWLHTARNRLRDLLRPWNDEVKP